MKTSEAVTKRLERRHTWIDSRSCNDHFFRIFRRELDKAKHLDRSALVLWLFIGTELSGNSRGWKIGGQAIQEYTGLSRASLYRAMDQLRSAGLVKTECARCEKAATGCEKHEKATTRHRII